MRGRLREKKTQPEMTVCTSGRQQSQRRCSTADFDGRDGLNHGMLTPKLEAAGEIISSFRTPDTGRKLQYCSKLLRLPCLTLDNIPQNALFRQQKHFPTHLETGKSDGQLAARHVSYKGCLCGFSLPRSC